MARRGGLLVRASRQRHTSSHSKHSIAHKNIKKPRYKRRVVFQPRGLYAGPMSCTRRLVHPDRFFSLLVICHSAGRISPGGASRLDRCVRKTKTAFPVGMTKGIMLT